jgi:hypothetical protein
MPEWSSARLMGMVFTVDRRGALIRQIDTAVHMWFFERDSLAIHVVAMAAHQCLCDLGSKDGNGPEVRTQVGKEPFEYAYDWLRHASSDPHDAIDFAPNKNSWVLWDAITSFEKIFGGSTAYMRAFQAFFYFQWTWNKPDARNDMSVFLPKAMTVYQLGALSRLEAFAKLTEMFAAEILSRKG